MTPRITERRFTAIGYTMPPRNPNDDRDDEDEDDDENGDKKRT